MARRHRTQPLTQEAIEILRILYKMYVPATTASKILDISNITIGKYYTYFRLSNEPTFTLNDILQIKEGQTYAH